jgi:hypothetical protein
MSELSTHRATASHFWLQHYFPWLSLLALMLGLLRDEREVGFDPEELNG